MKILPILIALCLSACAVTPSAADSIYDTTPPVISEYVAKPSVLIFSKTREWRHEEGIAGGNLFFLNLAKSKGYGVFTTQNAAVFNPEQISKFDVIIFNSFTGDGLSPKQELVFQDWLESGGGFLAIHGSGDSSHLDWSWYSEKLIGPTFVSHPMDPQFQEARVETLSNHPIMKGVPESWLHTEEWYTFDSVPGLEFTPLLGVDESTYSPVNNLYGDISNLRMGEGVENHPVMWSRCIESGRSFYSALGHLDTAFDVPEHQQILSQAFDWVTNKSEAGCAVK